MVGTEVAMAEGVAATHSKCSSPTGIMGKLLLRVQEILKRKCKTHHDYVYSFFLFITVFAYYLPSGTTFYAEFS